MTTSVKDRIKSELEQSQVNGKDRAARIGKILQSAAASTFEELKEGSTELNVVVRKSLSDTLQELQEETVPEVSTPETEVASVDDADAEQCAANEPTVPTWRDILSRAFTVVRDRRGDWWQSLKEHWQKNAAKVDQDMAEEYGDRYQKVKTFFQQAVTQLKAKSARSEKNGESDATTQPVTIEVLDDEGTVVEVDQSNRTVETDETNT